MKRFDWRWLAVSSLLLALAASAETRPQYGGTLRVAVRAAPTSLDPADGSQPDSFARRSVIMLMFDTLITVDDDGQVQPSLATSWQATPGNKGWRFRLRHGVKFDDGTPLTPEIAAASLRAANPSWNVLAEEDSVVVESERAGPDLLAELALPRNAIAKRNVDKKPSGTGPFHIVDWEPGKQLTLAAEENYWGGRPFLDGVEIEMGKSFRDQMTAFELGRADLVEVAPEQLHRVTLEGRHLTSSAPIELIALLFTRDATSSEDKTSREALAFSVDRGSIRSVLLQGTGQPAASVLPTWMSGYGFVFSTDADLQRARRDCEQVRAVIRSLPTWTLGYDGTDSLARLLAERVALNARDAGLILQPTTAPTVDVRLVRIPLTSEDPWVAIADVAALTGAPMAKRAGGSAEDLYAAEQTLLATQRLIPLFHLPASYAAAGNLHDLALRPDGSWNLVDAWLGSQKP
jgi:peptide/nickel transport system substrate-binding protein